MKLLYFFDDHIKHHIMKGKKYCNPADTGIYTDGISCIREDDVNMWLYTKDGMTVAFDAGHLNFKGLNKEFSKIGIDPLSIGHLFLTHADVDHAGGIDKCGRNIYPNAKVYLGRDEQQYLEGKMSRMKKLGVPLKNCVRIKSGYKLLSDRETLKIGTIKIEALHIPGHTLGHTCYLIDDRILISGDCLAVNSSGGYSFFDFFTQYPDMNKKSLHKLKEIVSHKDLCAVCTGHSGLITDIEHLFDHIDDSAVFGSKKPFDETAPYDFTAYRRLRKKEHSKRT